MLIEELLELEQQKNRALMNMDPASYETAVRRQLDLTDESGDTSPVCEPERLAQLSRLIRINTALVLNLMSITPWIARADAGYSPEGMVTSPDPLRFRART